MTDVNAYPLSHPAFVLYPSQAAFGRTLPKNKVYAYSRAGTRLKNLFVQQVEQIVWQFKLAPETINLPARPGVAEIQIFTIHVKTPDPSFEVLRAIDQAVPFPIIFELAHAGRIQVVACYKRPVGPQSVADASQRALSDYYASGWLSDCAERGALPMALHLSGLYEQLLRALLPLPARQNETVAEHIARLEAFAAKQREVHKTAAKLAKERQFNRKVAINAALRRLQGEADALRR